MNGVGSRLKQIREDLGLNLKQLAPQLGISRTALGKCERGESFPNKNILHILATRYNISMDYLLCNRGPVLNRETSPHSAVPKYKLDKEMEEMLILMTQSPLVYHSMLGFLQQFKINNQEGINTQLAQYAQLKENTTKP